MVIGYWHKREPGQKDIGEIRDVNKINHTIPFVVVREASYEEWLETFFELGGKEETLSEFLSKRGAPPYPYFYEIQTD